MDILNDAILAAVFTGLGLLISKWTDFFKVRRSENREDKKVEADIGKSETSQALDMYKSLIESLKTDMKELLGHLHQLEKDHLDCREENAKLRAEVKSLTDRVHILEEEKKQKQAA